MTEATATGIAGSTVWLWQRNATTGDLEQVAAPADLFDPSWIKPLQRRYAPGDRVSYTIGDEHGWQTGTVVQDQGMYAAIDGDVPGRYATAHKTQVRPLGEQPDEPAPPTARPMATPHGKPQERTSYRCINARWRIGEPVGVGAEWQASLTVRYSSTGGYYAALQTVLEQRTTEGISENWSYSNPAAVVYEQPAPRYSALRLREAYAAGLKALRDHFDAGDPVVTGFYTVPDTKPKEST